MRTLIISIGVTVVLCMAFLVFGVGIRLGLTGLVSLALGLLMMAALFAAISALGPKFSVTPTLTPTMAGVLAPVFVAVLVAGIFQPQQGQSSAPRPAEAATAEKSIPTEGPADIAVSNPPTAANNLAMMEPIAQPLVEAKSASQPLAAPAFDPGAQLIGGVLFSNTPMAPDAPVGTSDSAAVAETEIPIPVYRPSDPSVPLVAPESSWQAGNDVAAAPASVPVPRSRPCGGTWPPCP